MQQKIFEEIFSKTLLFFLSFFLQVISDVQDSLYISEQKNAEVINFTLKTREINDTILHCTGVGDELDFFFDIRIHSTKHNLCTHSSYVKRYEGTFKYNVSGFMFNHNRTNTFLKIIRYHCLCYLIRLGDLYIRIQNA